MKIYIAGPMRGMPDWNFPAFDEAERLWCGAGHTVFNPAANARAMRFAVEDSSPQRLAHVMQMDLACIYAADAIAVIAGWESSMGSTVEVALAQFLGKDIYCAKTFKKLNLLTTPWEFHRKALQSVVEKIDQDIQDNELKKLIP